MGGILLGRGGGGQGPKEESQRARVCSSTMGCRAVEGGGKSISMFLVHCISFQVMSVWAGGGGGVVVVFGILPVVSSINVHIFGG